MAITSPLDITWDHAYWLEGPEFLAMYPQAVGGGGGLKVGWMDLTPGVPADFTFNTWPDEVGTSDATTIANLPIWTAQDANFNGKPSARFPNGYILQSSNYATALTQPGASVIIARNHDDTTDKGRVFCGLNMWHIARGSTSTAKWRLYQGGSIKEGGTFDTSAHLFEAEWDTNDTLYVDGTSIISGSSAGTSSLTKTIIGQGSGALTLETLTIVFYGVKDSALTGTEQSDLHSWCSSYYGTP